MVEKRLSEGLNHQCYIYLVIFIPIFNESSLTYPNVCSSVSPFTAQVERQFTHFPSGIPAIVEGITTLATTSGSCPPAEATVFVAPTCQLVRADLPHSKGKHTSVCLQLTTL